MSNAADSVLLHACRREATPYTPIWLMRQAGRYLPEYRALRARHSMLTLLSTAELAAEITLQPLRRIDFDAAIIFSDLLQPLIGMGLAISYEDGVGPRVDKPISSARDIDFLSVPPALKSLASTLHAIEIAAADLAGRGKPVMGFCRSAIHPRDVRGGGRHEPCFHQDKDTHVSGTRGMGTIDDKAASQCSPTFSWRRPTRAPRRCKCSIPG